MRTRVVISVSSRRDGFINGADVNELVHALQSSRLVTILLYSGVAQLCLLCRSWSPAKYYQLPTLKCNKFRDRGQTQIFGGQRAGELHARSLRTRASLCLQGACKRHKSDTRFSVLLLGQNY